MSKSVFLILFQSDINRGVMCNYVDIEPELRRLCSNVVEFRTDTWFVESEMSAREITAELRSTLSGAESLFVSALGSDTSHFGILPEKIAAIARMRER